MLHVNIVIAETLFISCTTQDHTDPVRHGKLLMGDEEEHLTENLREKCIRIKVSAPC